MFYFYELRKINNCHKHLIYCLKLRRGLLVIWNSSKNWLGHYHLLIGNYNQIKDTEKNYSSPNTVTPMTLIQSKFSNEVSRKLDCKLRWTKSKSQNIRYLVRNLGWNEILIFIPVRNRKNMSDDDKCWPSASNL